MLKAKRLKSMFVLYSACAVMATGFTSQAASEQPEVTTITETDPLIVRAVTTFCRVNFGQPDDYDKLKYSYDEQKAQLQVATGYTNWGE